jgi:5-oxopent-3-ene-1,2,5-tricarboxylate decarboxylase/2-hydroxyhepta-2,4-diene-1,7-dioate isomerase
MIELSRVRTSEGWGVVDGDAVRLDDGRTIAEADAEYQAPVDPSKIVAVHLTYRSRLIEYAARTPAEPSYFLKPPSALNGHRRPIVRPKGASFV